MTDLGEVYTDQMALIIGLPSQVDAVRLALIDNHGERVVAFYIPFVLIHCFHDFDWGGNRGFIVCVYVLP